MKNLIIIFLAFLLSVQTCSRKIHEEITEQQIMYFEVDRDFNHIQLDSAFQSEGLPPLQYWMDGSSIVEGDSLIIRQWLYIQSDSIFYILTDQDTIANFKKRVIRTE